VEKIIKFIFSIFLKFLLVVVLATFLNTLFLRLIPGDPVEASLGRGVDEETKQIIHHQLGLDKGFIESFLEQLVKVVNWNFGNSIISGTKVIDVIKFKIMASFELVFFTFLFGFPLAIGIGIIAARRQGSNFYKIVKGTTISLASIPAYSIAILLLLIGSYYLNLFPSSGRIGFSYMDSFTPISGFYLLDAILQGNIKAFVNIAYHMFLPVLTLILCVIFPVVSRMTLNSIESQKNKPYLVALKAMGIPSRVIFWKHLIRAILPPLVSFAAVFFGIMLSGAIIIEYIFGWDGFGSLIVNSMVQRDYPLIQGCVILTSVIFVLVSMVTDLLVGIIDPRTIR
jgi:peptide/nickel transport system permease protein